MNSEPRGRIRPRPYAAGMDDFVPAAVTFTDDQQRHSRPRQALLYHPHLTIEEAHGVLAAAGAPSWPVCRIAGFAGVFATPAGNIPLNIFAQILLALGDNWELRANPETPPV